MKKFIKFIKQTAFAGCILSIVLTSCSKMNDLHDKYLEGEITYAAKVDSASVLSGRDRVLINMQINSQRIETVRIYWNDYLDSTDIAINNQVGMFSKILDNDMSEIDYIFYLVSFDKYGNKSLPFEASGTVYGDRYQSGLSNRSMQSVYIDNGELILSLGGAPEGVLYSELRYTNTDGDEQILKIPVDSSSLTISDWASDLRYRSLYKPNAAAIDTFYTAWREVDDIPAKYSTAGWTAECRDGNHDWGSQGGQPEKVLDGDRITGWHSRPGSSMPQCLVVDMKASQPVRHIMIWHHPNAISSNWIYFKTIEVYLTDTPATPDVYQPFWGSPVANYQYPGGVNGFTIELAPNSKGRYMILYFRESASSTYISFTELDVFK